MAASKACVTGLPTVLQLDAEALHRQQRQQQQAAAEPSGDLGAAAQESLGALLAALLGKGAQVGKMPGCRHTATSACAKSGLI